jgi:hypothetical protein
MTADRAPTTTTRDDEVELSVASWLDQGHGAAGRPYRCRRCNVVLAYMAVCPCQFTLTVEGTVRRDESSGALALVCSACGWVKPWLQSLPAADPEAGGED